MSDDLSPLPDAREVITEAQWQTDLAEAMKSRLMLRAWLTECTDPDDLPEMDDDEYAARKATAAEGMTRGIAKWFAEAGLSVQPAPSPDTCPNGCARFNGKVPGHTYGSNWDWVPCQDPWHKDHPAFPSTDVQRVVAQLRAECVEFHAADGVTDDCAYVQAADLLAGRPAPSDDRFVPAAEINRQRELGWPDFHPEAFCHRCGRPNPTWATTYWVQVVGSHAGILCPSCFIGDAQAAGFGGTWMVQPHTSPDPDLVADLAALLDVVTDEFPSECRRIASCVLDHLAPSDEERRTAHELIAYLRSQWWDNDTELTLFVELLERFVAAAPPDAHVTLPPDVQDEVRASLDADPDVQRRRANAGLRAARSDKGTD